mgnify:CR=1 FL=1
MNKNINFYHFLDHTFLKTQKDGFSPHKQKKSIEKLSLEANKFDVAAVCVRPWQLQNTLAGRKELHGQYKIATAHALFPFHQMTSYQKIKEIEIALQEGSEEIDFLIPLESVLRGQFNSLYLEVSSLHELVGRKTLKIIFETAALTEELKKKAIETVVSALQKNSDKKEEGLRFLKTSTGYFKEPYTIDQLAHDLHLFHYFSKGRYSLKPSGGIRTNQQIMKLLALCPFLDLTPNKFRIGSGSLIAQKATLMHY